MRENAESTFAIPDPGKFLSASTDGSRVLLQNGHLYDLETETTTDLSAGKGGFAGVLGQSEDLTHVYFVDTAVLTGEEENSEGDKAQPGKFNLYAFQEGTTTRFVASLVGEDNTSELSSDWATTPSGRTAQASPDGDWVAFLSQAPLTGYDNTGPCIPDHLGGYIDGPCPEAFLYQAATGELRCASCNPSNATPLGWTVLRRIRVGSGARFLTDTGRLYFDSADSLSPLDTNEGAEDVYQFEPEGIGSCEREGGCVDLISAGRADLDSNFLAMGASGRDAFFTTRERLVAADTDELIDLYDAREGGGPPPPGESPPGESPLQPAPAESTPASPTLVDPGNVKPKGCKKGQVKKKGKCVKKQKPKSKAKKSDHRRGGAK